ncbi:hypothetical protein GWK26_11890 [haloarchaeon 3A1-DGR]|nr:hypothetical protein GWK26_11890 [haloarchaeon 3A1-DGR]
MTDPTCQAIVGEWNERCGKALEQLVSVGNLEEVPLCPEHADAARRRHRPASGGRANVV